MADGCGIARKGCMSPARRKTPRIHMPEPIFDLGSKGSTKKYERRNTNLVDKKDVKLG
jgi:hypothetical protein